MFEKDDPTLSPEVLAEKLALLTITVQKHVDACYKDHEAMVLTVQAVKFSALASAFAVVLPITGAAITKALGWW